MKKISLIVAIGVCLWAAQYSFRQSLTHNTAYLAQSEVVHQLRAEWLSEYTKLIEKNQPLLNKINEAESKRDEYSNPFGFWILSAVFSAIAAICFILWLCSLSASRNQNRLAAQAAALDAP